MPSSGSSLTVPGRNSSMGNESTSVGPSWPIHFSLYCAIPASSVSLMHSSACGWTRSRSSTKRLSAAIRRASAPAPDSSRTSTLMEASSGRRSRLAQTRTATVRETRRGVPRLELVVGRNDLAHQPVAYDVVAGEPVERHVLQTVEDLLDHPQTASGATGKVHL